jgi:DNA polymerase elongation subunit (family B)
MLQDLAIHFQKGAEHYGERNCQKGIPLWSFKDSAMRHATQLFAGKKDEPHAISVIWNCWMAQWTVLHEQEQTDTNNESHMIFNTLKARTPEEIETARIRSMSVDEVIAKVKDILITKRREIKAEQYKHQSDTPEYKELDEKQKRLKYIISNIYLACSEIAICSFGVGYEVPKDAVKMKTPDMSNDEHISGNDTDDLSAIMNELKTIAEKYNTLIITARQGSHTFTDEELEMFITTRIETFLADKHNLERIFASIDTKDLASELFRRLDIEMNKKKD